MNILYDTHLHTEFSTDSEAPVESQVERAIELGLDGICITDHMDYGFPKEQYKKNINNPFTFDVDIYKRKLEEIKEKYIDIEVYTGIECGLQSLAEVVAYNQRLCADEAFDQIIGSIHLVDKVDPYYPEYWEGITEKEGIRKYFETMLKNIQLFSDFDTLGHLDYIVRYAPKNEEYIPRDYFDITDEIMRIIIRKDIALEMNTSALKTDYGVTNPHPDFLKRYRELGGDLITVGSDAHAPEYMGYGFDEAAELLKAEGFDEYFAYEKRRPYSQVIL